MKMKMKSPLFLIELPIVCHFLYGGLRAVLSVPKHKGVEPFSLNSGSTFWTNVKQEDRIVLHTRLI